MEYNESIKYREIENVWKYTVQVHPQFDDHFVYPPNSKWFQYGPSGVLNLTNCSEGVPVFISLPLFLSSPEYALNLSSFGLPQPRWEWQPFIAVEPRTGAIFTANKSLQTNLLLRSLPFKHKNASFDGIKSLRNIPDDIMVPIANIADCSDLSEHTYNLWIKEVEGALKMAAISTYIGYVAVAMLAVYVNACCFGLGRYQRLKTRKHEKEDIQ